MGCGNSKEESSEEGGLTNRRPLVEIEIGSNVKKTEIVFVFGGPGSKKGRIVDDLVHMYGFKSLIVEDLIARELPKKIQSPVAIGNTREMAKLLMENSSYLTLEWVLELLEKEFEKEPDSMFIIDFVPNLRYMLRCDQFILEDPSYEMNQFQKKYSNIFALNLAIPEKAVMKQATAHCAKHPNQMQEGGKSDEVDTGRLAKRHGVYMKSVQGFLNYFRNDGRLASVDVSSGVSDLIWHQVTDFFGHKLEFVPRRTINTVVLFGFSPNAHSELDLNRYNMEKVILKDLTDNPMGPVVEVLKALCTHIDNSSATAESFLVDVSETSLTKDELKYDHKVINFIQDENAMLDRFIFVTSNSQNNKKSRKCSAYMENFKAACSTENEVCLFPMDMDTNICKGIAFCMAELRDLKE
ncbi:uncharacterized protein LOC117117717 [Anneissia japonica]|uniref:uncharacterized protein LOC117117717 n=1 Tax=Anneissia japonica TaxID=1529436 RepID=UPI00142552CB|nr:uncharacterized protein LOC117117717 [Anneissia japonica]